MAHQKNKQPTKEVLSIEDSINTEILNLKENNLINQSVDNIKKYYYLLSRDDKPGEALLDNEKFVEGNNIIIARENNNGMREYMCIHPESLSLFGDRDNLHEVILGGCSRRLMLDIDIDLTKNTTINEVIANDILVNIIDAVWLYFIYNKYDTEQVKQYKVMKRHRIGKLSWHVLFESIYCVNSDHMKVVMNGICKFIKKCYRKYFDICVSNKNSNMSILNYSNKGYKLVMCYDHFVAINNSFIKDVIYNGGGDKIDIVDDVDSYNAIDHLITYFDKDNSYLIPGYNGSLVNDIKYIDINDDEIKNMVELANKYIPNIMKNFDIRVRGQMTCNNIINFDRKVGCGSYCDICNKTHDHDNTFVLIRYDDGLYWSCRRRLNERRLIKKFDEKSNNKNSGKNGVDEKKKSKNDINIDIIKDIIAKQNILRKQKKLLGEEKYNEIYVCEFGDFNDSLIVKSAKGTGKTYALREFIRSLDKGSSVGCISFRKTLTTAMVARLNDGYVDLDNKNSNDDDKVNDNMFIDYRNIIGKINNKRWVCQLEAICRIDNCEIDVLVIDEFNQVIKQLISIQGVRANDIFARFKLIMRKAKRIIIMDADINNKSIEIFKRLRGECETRIIHNYYTSSYNVRITTNENKTKEYIANKLLNGKKICVVVNHGIRYIHTLAKQLENVELYKVSNDNIQKKIFKGKKGNTNNSIVANIKKKKVLVICSDTINANGYTLKDVNKYWREYDCVIYSPSVQSGVSFDLNYFDCVVGFFCNTSCNYTDCSQMMHRVRHTKERIVCLNTMYTPYKPCKINEMEKYITVVREATLNLPYEEIEKGIYHYPFKNDYYYTWLEIECEKNRSRQNFIQLFMQAELQQGAKLVYWEDNPYIEEVDADVNDYLNSLFNEKKTEVSKIEEEKKIISKTKFRKGLDDMKKIVIEEELNGLVNNKKQCDYIKRVYNMPNNKEYKNTWYKKYGDKKTITIYKNLCALEEGIEELNKREISYYRYMEKNNVVTEVNTYYKSIKHKITNDLLNIMMFKNIYDKKVILAKCYDDKLLKKINTYMRKNWEIIRISFNIRKVKYVDYKRISDIVQKINIILMSMYGVKINSKNQGKKNSIISYSLKHTYYGSLFTKKKNSVIKPIIKKHKKEKKIISVPNENYEEEFIK